VISQYDILRATENQLQISAYL